MKQGIFIFLFFLFGGYMRAQNLVPNGSFEQLHSCPNSTGQVDSCLQWFAVQNTPDYFASCSPYPVSVPDNLCGSQLPFDGNAYMGLYTYIWAFRQYREIIGTKLLDKLIPGNTYQVSMRVSRGNWTNQAYNVAASNKLGVRFTKDESELYPNNTSNYDTIYVDNNAQLYTDSIITDTLNWVLLHWNYIADSAYSYMYIGNFFTDEFTDTSVIAAPLGQFGQAYYFIDSVNVFCVSENCFVQAQNVIAAEIRMLFETSSNALLVQMENNHEAALSIVNVTGQVIRREKVSGEVRINLSGLQAGLYIATLKTEKKVMTQKFIIR